MGMIFTLLLARREASAVQPPIQPNLIAVPDLITKGANKGESEHAANILGRLGFAVRWISQKTNGPAPMAGPVPVRAMQPPSGTSLPPGSVVTLVVD
jgi:hypothetical protein